MAAAKPEPEAETVADATATITVPGPLGDDQRARLAEVAERTPVTRAVRAGTEIRTTVEQA
jgi:putative redox protein